LSIDFQLGQFFEVAFDQIGELPQGMSPRSDGLTLAQRRSSKARPRGGDRAIWTSSCRLRDIVDDAPVAGL